MSSNQRISFPPDTDSLSSGGAISRRRSPLREGAGFYDITIGLLIAGRIVPSYQLTLGQTLGLYDLVYTKWNARFGDMLRCVPAGDLSSSRLIDSRDEFTHLPVLVGLKVATAMADDGPSSPLTLTQMQQSLVHAQELPPAFWKELASLLPQAQAQELVRSEDRLYLVGAGPLPTARLAFGVLADTQTAPPRGLRQVRGGTMDRKAFPTCVLGTLVAEVSPDGPSVARIALDEPSHAERLSKAHHLAFPGYYLMAQYD